MVEYDFSTMPDRCWHVLTMHAMIGAYSSEGRGWMEQLKQVLETNIELAINFFQNDFKQKPFVYCCDQGQEMCNCGRQ